MYAARVQPRNIFLRSSNRYKLTRGVRFQSNASGNPGSSAQSHILSGLAGGAVVVLAGYSYYHFSGAKKVIDNAKAMKASMIQAKDRFVEKTPEPRVMLQYLRSTAKAYAGFVPGASSYVDATFDSIDQVADTHNEEFNKILTGAYEDLRPVVQNGALEPETAKKVFEIIRKRTLELHDLSTRVSSDVFGHIFDKHPEVKEKLGSSYDQVKKLASQSGPEARRITTETAAKLTKIFSGGFGDDSVEKAKQILQDAASQLQKVAGDTGAEAKQAWQNSMQQAQPYLDKLPEIKDLLNSNASSLMNADKVKQIWDRVKETGQQNKPSKDKIEDLKRFINEKAKGAGDSSKDVWDNVLQFSKGIPGKEKLAELSPKLEGFVAVVREGNEDAKELAEETFADIMRVLDEKSEKAKSLKEKAKEEMNKRKN